MVTDNYILMCEQAKQLQNAWEPKDWDIFVYRDDKEMDIQMYMEGEYNRKEMWIVDGIYIWLPTQEQLWEEVWNIVEASPSIAFTFKITKCLTVIALYIGEYIEGEGHERVYSGNDVKECLLKFIYKDKYHKIWAGEKWGESGINE